MNGENVRENVRQHYAGAALKVLQGGAGCCGGPATSSADPITSDLYGEGERALVPADAVTASFGCGNPTSLAELHPGEVVLDLGSGGGIDVLLTAQRVGPAGKAYGLDMTDEMLAIARKNQQEAGLTNVEFLKGEMESVPLPDGHVDVIISNCVINLAADKNVVLREAYRVLKPGGRLAISDIVVRGEVPAEVRRSIELWAGCVAGALEETEYGKALADAGFEEIGIDPVRIYRAEDACGLLSAEGIDAQAIAPHVDGKFMSAFIRARKPALPRA